VKIDKGPINENRSEQLSGATQNQSAAGASSRLAADAAGTSVDKIELAGGHSLLARAKEASPLVEAERMSRLSALMADGSYEPDPQIVSEGLIQETEELG
jgi:anti-sigma28 factor (negative regulator of flagellin synthesis)